MKYKTKIFFLFLALLLFFVLPSGLKASDLKEGDFLVKNGQIVRIESVNLPLRISYDDGKIGSVPNESGLEKLSDYSSIPTVIKKNISKNLLKVEKKILCFEKKLKEEFEGTYLELKCACLMADAEYSNKKISNILTEQRTFSLEKLSNTCKDYNYIEDLKVVFDQCKFYEAFYEFAYDELNKMCRAAEREINWLESNLSVNEEDKSGLAKKIDIQKTLLQRYEKNKLGLNPIKTIVENAKPEAENLDKQYYRVYNKTNDIFLLYSKLYDKLINQLSLKNHVPEVDSLIDDWTNDFIPDNLKTIDNLETIRKKLYKRRNPSAELKASLSVVPKEVKWGESIDVCLQIVNTGNTNANVDIRLFVSSNSKYGDKDDCTIEVWHDQKISNIDLWLKNSCIKLPSEPYNSYFPLSGNVFFVLNVERVEGELDISDNIAEQIIEIKKKYTIKKILLFVLLFTVLLLVIFFVFRHLSKKGAIIASMILLGVLFISGYYLLLKENSNNISKIVNKDNNSISNIVDVDVIKNISDGIETIELYNEDVKNLLEHADNLQI